MSAEKPMSGAVVATEMELRVAEAMYNANPAKTERHLPWDQMDFGYKLPWIATARAAIRAMRGPTEDMVNYAYDRDATGGKAACERMWMDMIKAASPTHHPLPDPQ